MNGLILVLLGIVCVLLGLWISRKASPLTEWPVTRRAVMSPPEQLLYWRLIQALPEHLVLAQVQLCRFMEIAKTPKMRNRCA